MEINSNQQPSIGSQSGSLNNAQRPGEHLRQLRVIQKRELSEVARELNMPERQLNALEADDYKALPEPAFIKGYFRAYARLLGTDSNPLIHRFEEIYTNDTGLPTNHALENSPIKVLGRLQRGRRVNLSWLKWLLMLLIAVALIAALVLGVRAWRNSHPAQPDQTELANAGVNNAAQAPAIRQSTNQAATVLAVPEQVNTLGSTASEDQLSLTFSHPVSVSIKDSTGKELASGSQSKPLVVKGASPFSIRLDDAAAVSLAFNQEQISLSPYTVNGRADFRLSR